MTCECIDTLCPVHWGGRYGVNEVGLWEQTEVLEF